MAYFQDDDKLKPQELQNPQEQMQQQLSGGSAGAFAGGAPASSNALSPQGAPSAPAWTNIQAYMQANRNPSQTGSLLRQDFGGKLEQEKQKFDTEANQAKTQAETQANQAKQAKDQASQLIEQASKNYSYQGQQQDPYNQAVGQLKQGIAGYTAPRQFNYAMGQDAARIGEGLQDNGAFKNILGEFYAKRAGRALGTGARSLQDQFDTGDQEIANARADLQNQYSGLRGHVDQGIQATDQAVKQAAGQFDQSSNALRDQLIQQSTGDRQAMDAALAAAKDEHSRRQRDKPSWIYRNLIQPEYSGRPEGAEQWGTDMYLGGTYNTVGDMLSYTQPNEATMENLHSVDEQRNRFNAIMDALGLSDRVGRSDQGYEQGKWIFDREKHRKAFGY